MNILNKLTLLSLKMNKKRTIVTVIGIILSGAMICGVTTIAASFQDLFLQEAARHAGNHHATFHDVKIDNIKYISGNPDTEAVLLRRDLGFSPFPSSKNENKPYLHIQEFDGAAFENMPVKLLQGRLPEKEGEAVITQEAYTLGGVRYGIGYSLTLDIGSRKDSGKLLTGRNPYSTAETLEFHSTKAYTITGIIAKPPFESARNPGFSMIAYLDEASLTAYETVDVSIMAKNPRKIFEKGPKIAENAGVEEITYNNELLKWSGTSLNNYYNDFVTSH